MVKGARKKGAHRAVQASRYRRVLQANLKQLMASREDLNSSPKLEIKSKVSIATINRLRRAEDAATLDTLDALAAAFGLETWQLLVPGLNPADPPTLALTAAERTLKQQFIETVNAITRASGARSNGDGVTPK